MKTLDPPLTLPSPNTASRALVPGTQPPPAAPAQPGFPAPLLPGVKPVLLPGLASVPARDVQGLCDALPTFPPSESGSLQRVCVKRHCCVQPSSAFHSPDA